MKLKYVFFVFVFFLIGLVMGLYSPKNKFLDVSYYSVDCDPGNNKFSKKLDNSSLSFCYPETWSLLEQERPTGDLYLSLADYDGDGILYIQMQLSHHSLDSIKEDFYENSGTNIESIGDLDMEKMIVLEDLVDEFGVYNRLYSTNNRLNNTIYFYKSNSSNENEVMRFWFFYDDDDPLLSVREESKVFVDLIKSFRWDAIDR